MIWSPEDVKTQKDINKYGWEMRLMQLEEDIALLEEKRKEYYRIYLGLCEGE